MLPVVWLTGLPAAGKTTLGGEVVRRLEGSAVAAVLVDGDELRSGACADLGFDRAARLEQARRAALFALAARSRGQIPVVATISPYREGRLTARALVGAGFLEVHVHASLAACEQRDPKGLYARARRGEVDGITGIDDPYEPPRDPDLRIDTERETAPVCAGRVLELIGRARADGLDSAA